MDRFLRSVLLVSLLALPWSGGCGQEGPPSPPQLTTVALTTHPDSLAADPTRDEEFQFILDSYRRVGPLHTIVLCGDFQQLLDIQHWGIMLELDRRESSKPPNRHGCSMFQFRSENGAFLGRNFDHKFSEMLVAWCFPDSGYASLGLVPLNQWGFTEDRPFDPGNQEHLRSMLGGPAATIEGMNEQGVTVTLASLDKQKIVSGQEKEPRFLIHLVREILDHAGSLEEAIRIAERYHIFDNGRNIISHHIFLSSPTQGSAVLEWNNGVMEIIRSGPAGQVVTNRPLYQRSEDDLRKGCRRYRSLAHSLDQAGPGFGWQEGMQALEKAAQHNVSYIIEGERWRVSTQWSAIFDMTHREAYVSWGRDYRNIYRFAVPSTGE